VAFRGTADSGHSIVIDGPPDKGGENCGMRPMEAVLVGAACCSAYDVVTILRKSKVELESCGVEVSSERAEEEPKVFTKIHLKFLLAGEGITDSKAERAVALSVEKHCSALKMLERTAAITHEWQIAV